MATVDGTHRRSRRPRRPRRDDQALTGAPVALELAPPPPPDAVSHLYRPWCRCPDCGEYRNEARPRPAPEWTEEDLAKVVAAAIHSAELHARWRLEGPWPRIVRGVCIGSVLVIALVAFLTVGPLALWLLLLACAISFIGGAA